MKKYLKSPIARGFTLMELLVVISIIAILMAIIIPNLSSARARGRDAKRIADIKTIQIALSVYYDTHRSIGYPTNIYEPGILSPTYIATVPTDPLGGEYSYAALASSSNRDKCISYHLGAELEGATQADGDVDASLDANYCTYEYSDKEDFDGTVTGMYDVKP